MAIKPEDLAVFRSDPEAGVIPSCFGAYNGGSKCVKNGERVCVLWNQCKAYSGSDGFDAVAEIIENMINSMDQNLELKYSRFVKPLFTQMMENQKLVQIQDLDKVLHTQDTQDE